MNLLKNINKISLSIFIAISVLTLNLSGLMQCTSLTMSDDCRHITKQVKPCCLKNMKITFAERISEHCGCTLEESQQPNDLYSNLKNSNSSLNSRSVSYNSTIETGYHPELINKITAIYSPPLKYYQDSFLTNLSLRI